MKWRSELPDSEGWWWHREKYLDHPWPAPIVVEVRQRSVVFQYRWPGESGWEPPPIQPPDSEWTMEWAKAEEPEEGA